MVNGQENTNLKEVAVRLGVSLRTVYRVLHKVRSGELIHNDRVVVPAKAKGRKRVFSSRTCEVVRDVLTSDTTMTLERAKAESQRRGINMSTSTIWLIATKKLGLSHKKITPKLAEVFDDHITNQRQNYAERVNPLPD